MPGGGDGDVGADQRVIPHVDMGVIHTGQVEIGVDEIAEMAVLPAPVGMEGWFDIAPLPELGEHLRQQRRSGSLFGGAGGVEFVQFFQAKRLLRHDLIVIWKV